MLNEQIARYPDYLQEFDEIKALAEWQRVIIRGINPFFNTMQSLLKLVFRIGENWEEMLYDTLKTHDEEDIKLLHRRFPVTTLEVLENYMRIWLPEKKSAIEYDKDTLTVKVKIMKDTDTPVRRKLTRDLLPCNMVLEFEVVEELG